MNSKATFKVKIIALFLVGVSLFSCQQRSASITLKMDKKEVNELELKQYGELVAKATRTNPDQEFLFAIEDVTPGYYSLDSYPVYLYPGCELTIDSKNNVLGFSGKGSLENGILENRIKAERAYNPLSDDMIEKTEMGMKAYKDFLGQLTETLDKNLQDTNLDANFVAQEKERTKKLMGALMVNYTTFHGMNTEATDKITSKLMANQDKMNDPEFMKQMQKELEESRKNMLSIKQIVAIQDSIYKDFDYNDELPVAMASFGGDWLLDHKIKKDANTLMRKDGSRYSTIDMFKRDIIVDSIQSPYVKGPKLADNTLLIVKTQPRYADEAFKKYLDSDPKEVYKKQIVEAYDNLNKLKTGAKSPEFKDYLTIEDKPVSLSDLKGKYVYIDIWATWCAPCKKEIPFLKEIEQKYHGKDIEFVSISVDVEGKRQKWKDMVKDMELKGIQIMADNNFKSDFIKAYNIVSIPRFILLDPEGKIVSADAKRPSDPALGIILDQLLTM